MNREESREDREYAEMAYGSWADIPTPEDQQDIAPTDSMNEAVEQIVDNIQEAFTGRRGERE